jgi:hypothetical protein
MRQPAAAPAGSEATPALGPVAVGLHADGGRLMGRLLAGVAEGVVEHVRQPVAEPGQA